MSRTEIIEKIAERIYGNTSEDNIKQVTQFCDTLVDIFTDALINEEKIIWRGFLSAEVVQKKQRKGRHPQTNEIVDFPPTKTIKCKISQHIRDMVNEE